MSIFPAVPSHGDAWQLTPLGATAPPRGRYLLVAGGGSAAQQLQSQLTAAGVECEIASSAQEALARGGWDGIILAAALDMPAMDALVRIQESFVNLKTAARSGPRVWVVTAGARKVLPGEQVDPVQATVFELARVSQCNAIDLGSQWAPSVPGLCAELAGNAGSMEAAWRAGQRYTVAPPLEGSTSTRKRLHIRERGSLENIELRPAQRRRPGPGQIEIEVDVTAMSFRDVLNLLGLYPGDPGPLGGECAGHVVSVGQGVDDFKTGDEVVAIAAGAHDGYVLAEAYMTAHKPPNLDLEDALTFPSSFMTAVFTLEHLAAIAPGQRVLIHAGTGGVGLAAIQVAQRAGAEIFATAGTEEKRAFLKSIGVQHTMSSRTAEFAEYIQRETGGHGVDIVLNSLANELLDASFAVTAHGGVFVEIGKNGIWTQERVEQLGKSIAYHIVDWGDNAREDPQLIHKLLMQIVEDAGTGLLRPLPKKVFSFDEATEAFRHMARARHIGRVLLRQTAEDLPVRGDGTYVVLGDLRGEGIQALQWLVRNGARKVTLLDATHPPPAALRSIRELARKGVQVTPARVEDCGRVLGPLASELRGVIHAGDPVAVDPLWNLYRAVAAAPLDFFVILNSREEANESDFAPAFAEGVVQAMRARGVRAASMPSPFKQAAAEVPVTVGEKTVQV